jgi:hypothetical protein
MGKRGPYPEDKARQGRDSDHSPHLVLRSRMSRGYNSYPPLHLLVVAGQLYFYNILYNVRPSAPRQLEASDSRLLFR